MFRCSLGLLATNFIGHVYQLLGDRYVYLNRCNVHTVLEQRVYFCLKKMKLTLQKINDIKSARIRNILENIWKMLPIAGPFIVELIRRIRQTNTLIEPTSVDDEKNHVQCIYSYMYTHTCEEYLFVSILLYSTNVYNI